MKAARRYLLSLLVLGVVLLSGCATVPMASSGADAEAKKFTPVAGKSLIYVYRNETLGAAIKMRVSLNGQNAGETGPKTYFMFEVPPGRHEILSHTENVSTLAVNAEPGRIYFVWQEVKMGLLQARSQLQLVSEEVGRAGVSECNRIQSQL